MKNVKNRLGLVMRLSPVGLIAGLLSGSCAQVESPEEDANSSTGSTTSVTTGGSSANTGGNSVVVTTGGAPMGVGGTPGGVTGGTTSGTGGMGMGGGVPPGSSCSEDSDCRDSGGCDVCGLVGLVFECQEASELTECGASCVDLSSDANHCGKCDNSCVEGQICNSGNCECPDDVCDGVCVNLDSDPTHCGTCDHECVTGASCDGGSCVCPASQEVCGDSCIDTQSNVDHCGECDNQCAVDAPFCVEGVCSECEVAGELDCGGGCIDVSNDDAHCGACDHACDMAGGKVCNDSACVDSACVDVDPYDSGRSYPCMPEKQRVTHDGYLWECCFWANAGQVPSGTSSSCGGQPWRRVLNCSEPAP